MNKLLLEAIYNLAKNSSEERVSLPSIRWFSMKYKVSNNDVVRVINFYKEMGLIITEPGSKTFLYRTPFMRTFKNDSELLFGDKKIARKVISKDIKKIGRSFVNSFERHFVKSGKVIAISIDHIYIDKDNSNKVNLKDGVDKFISNIYRQKKNVSKEATYINISGMPEIKILKYKECMLIETKVYSLNNNLITHSFLLMEAKYYKSYQIEFFI